MEAIFHEKQEGSLCAQHCLNALLQGSYFSAVDLANLAKQLDDEEHAHFKAGSTSRDMTEAKSQNMDDSGFFSVQVISRALTVWGLELVPFLSQNEQAVQARSEPTDAVAYICNLGEHWFVLRRLGMQWFDLNSVSSGPRLISPTYLAIYLAQLQQEGHSIFLVVGNLPSCEADQLLSLCPVTGEDAARAQAAMKRTTKSAPVDKETREAIALVSSLEATEAQSQVTEEDGQAVSGGLAAPEANSSLYLALQLSRAEQEETEMRRALELSMQSASDLPPSTSATDVIGHGGNSVGSGEGRAVGGSGQPKGDSSIVLAKRVSSAGGQQCGNRPTDTLSGPDAPPAAEDLAVARRREVRDRRQTFLNTLQ